MAWRAKSSQMYQDVERVVKAGSAAKDTMVTGHW
jgi:hypothetical protein